MMEHGSWVAHNLPLLKVHWLKHIILELDAIFCWNIETKREKTCS